MALLKKGDLLIGEVLLTASAARMSPRYVMIATDPRRLLVDREEAARAAMALEVALSQPHRKGDASKSAGDALVRFCEQQLLRPECLRAGQDYDFEVRAEKTARGFYVDGQCDPPDGMPMLTEEQRAAKAQAAIMALKASNEVPIAISRYCPGAMSVLCFERRTPRPEHEGILRHGLLNLARHYGLLNEGINRDKPI